MTKMKTCPICSARALSTARTCFVCYYRFSDMSTRDVIDIDQHIRKRSVSLPQLKLSSAKEFQGVLEMQPKE